MNPPPASDIRPLFKMNANTFTGNVAISQGMLEVSDIGNQGSLTSNLGAGTTVTMGGGANPANLNYAGAGETTNRNIVLQGGGQTHLKSNGAGALVWNGTISNVNTAAARIGRSIRRPACFRSCRNPRPACWPESVWGSRSSGFVATRPTGH
jgi:hypothetical protein